MAAKKSKCVVRQIDVAREANVSQATVSYVLNKRADGLRQVSQATISRIEEVAARLGYRPNTAARQLRGERSHLMGILVDMGAPPVMFHRIAMIEREAMQKGYRVLVGQVDGLQSLAAYVDDFASRGVDFLVCMVHEDPHSSGEVARCVSAIEHVVFLRRPAIEDALYVDIDAGDGIRQAIDHLVATGRRRIAIQLVNDTQTAHTDRLEAYRAALREHGLSTDDALIWVGGKRLLPDPQVPRRDVVEDAVSQFIDQGKADAMIAINDNWAALMLKILGERGLVVPRDVALVGQGDFQLGTLITPELTTLDPRNDLFGTSVVRLLVEMARGGDEKIEPDVIKPRLVVRGST